jgi:cytochrome P450
VRSRESRFPVGASVELAELDADAHAVLTRLRAAEPVSWVGAWDCWLVTGYAAAVEVMRDSTTFTVDDPRFSTARVVGSSMLSLDGREHSRHRAPFVPPFRPAKVRQRFGRDVEGVVRGLVDGFRASGSVELRRGLAGPLSVAVVAEVLGLAATDADTVLGWYAAIVDAVSQGRPDRPVPDDARRAMRSLTEHVHGSLAAGRPESLLAAAARSLDEQQVVANAAVMMFGGIETTEGMVLNAVQQVLAAGFAGQAADPDALPALVEESLRLEPAAAVVDRYATRDVHVHGAAIEAGDLVRVSLAGANRDPAEFPEPDAFQPARPNVRSQLAFARGPHVCVAMDLARLEAQVALHALVTSLPGLRLTGESPARGLVFRKPRELRLAWDR